MKKISKIIISGLIIILSCHWASCEIEQNDHKGVPPKFATYDQASSWYQRTGDLDWMYPESTAIAKAAFHNNDKVMLIYFTSKPSKGYIFGDVPLSVWKRFKSAPSKGKFYNQVIKGRYRYSLRDD